MDVQQMIREYTDWLNGGFSAARSGEFVELTTPYMDRYNDHLQIYVRQDENGAYFMTDGGAVIRNLKSSGVSFSRSQKRKQMLKRITGNFGVTMNGDALEIHTEKKDFPRKKHMLIQTMLAVDDMFMAEPNAVKNFFAEDVGLFLDAHEIYYSRDFSLIGKTGSIIVYDYHLQRTRDKPERFCKAINHVNRSARDMTLFNWLDTIEARADKSELILFLNDGTEINSADLNAFRSYEVKCIPWSQRQNRENLALLAA